MLWAGRCGVSTYQLNTWRPGDSILISILFVDTHTSLTITSRKDRPETLTTPPQDYSIIIDQAAVSKMVVPGACVCLFHVKCVRCHVSTQ